MLTKALQFLWSQLCQKDFYLPSSNVLPKMLSLKSTAVIPQASYEFSLIYSSWGFLFFFLGDGGQKCVFLQTCNIRPRAPQRKITSTPSEPVKSVFGRSVNDLVFITQKRWQFPPNTPGAALGALTLKNITHLLVQVGLQDPFFSPPARLLFVWFCLFAATCLFALNLGLLYSESCANTEGAWVIQWSPWREKGAPSWLPQSAAYSLTW